MIQQLIPVNSFEVVTARFKDDKDKPEFMRVEAWALVGIGEGQRVLAMIQDGKGLVTVEEIEKKYSYILEYIL
jgi:hypothetical protein